MSKAFEKQCLTIHPAEDPDAGGGLQHAPRPAGERNANW
jgi:hypothetical protein